MGKPNKPRIASSINEGDDIRTIVIEAMTNQQVINAIAEKVAEAIAEKFEQRLSLCEQDLRNKGTQMKVIETKMARMYVDQLEQYSRRTGVRISGVQESELGEEYNAFKKANSGNNATRIHSRGLNPISSYTAVQSTSSQA